MNNLSGLVSTNCNCMLLQLCPSAVEVYQSCCLSVMHAYILLHALQSLFCCLHVACNGHVIPCYKQARQPNPCYPKSNTRHNRLSAALLLAA
jgi:hypothetical protein